MLLSRQAASSGIYSGIRGFGVDVGEDVVRVDAHLGVELGYVNFVEPGCTVVPHHLRRFKLGLN